MGAVPQAMKDVIDLVEGRVLQHQRAAAAGAAEAYLAGEAERRGGIFLGRHGIAPARRG